MVQCSDDSMTQFLDRHQGAGRILRRAVADLFDIAAELDLQLLDGRVLSLLAEPVDQFQVQRPAIEVAIEADEVRFDLRRLLPKVGIVPMLTAAG